MYNLILVDDEMRSINAIENNIEWKHCGIGQVYKAMNIESAIKIIKKHEVDIMICDIEMPNGTGLELLEWFRSHKYDIACIFVTCHPEFTYMRKAIQLGCYDYILKPINYEEFTKVLQGLIKKMRENEVIVSDSKEMILENIIDEVVYQGVNERDIEKEVKEYIRIHLAENINIKSIADELHYNPQYLMRMFKTKTGFGIMQYITSIRMEKSKALLKETKLAVRDVANMVGYSDYAYFARVFRKEYGSSPSQYRREVNKD